MRYILSCAFFLVLSLSLVYSDDKPKALQTILAEIRQEQNLKGNDQIDADKVSAAKLEELGDSVMELMIGNSEKHEQMDAMMGGEGSTSLSAMHQRIGYNYLSGYPLGMMNMMSNNFGGFAGRDWGRRGGYMMDGNYYGMMGNWHWGYGPMIMWILIIVILVFVGYVVFKSVKGGMGKGSDETPMQILKKRYAKGEITKEEFDKMKHDLNS